MITRRTFVGAVGAGVAASQVGAGENQPRRRRLAVVTTVWRERSHAWHMAERFLHGYPTSGRWHRPAFEVVSAYVDQTPRGDLSQARAREFGFRIYPSIAQALRHGGDKLAVDAVLIIGEHGDYPTNKFGQKEYPRYEFFRQCVEVFRRDGRSVPIFNDKHLSWNFDWAKEMVETSQKLGFGFSAGSSLPVTWRMPAIDLPYGAEVDEVMCLAFGGVDSYDFHALEVMQCMAERRRGGERGVAWLHALRGPAVWKALTAGSFQAGGWDPALLDACLCRSQTLAQAAPLSHRFPTRDQIQAWVKNPVVYRFEYADGLKATMLLMNGLVSDFTFAAKIRGQAEPLSTLFYLPPLPNVAYSAPLMAKAEQTFASNRSPDPIERTLLTSGLVAAGCQSLTANQTRINTPHLAVRYTGPRESQFARS
jgi:hypothetical protein